MTPTPPRSRVEAPRWYSVTRDGAATLCVDEDDARQVASESDEAWPRMGPHRAVQLVDASAIAELEQECERLRNDALITIERHQLNPADVLRRFIRNARPRRGKLKWVAVHEATAHGSTVSMGLCHWAGVDPDTGAALAAQPEKG